jgi:RNA polymerase sigma-70 factor (ECF subfamily)
MNLLKICTTVLMHKITERIQSYVSFKAPKTSKQYAPPDTSLSRQGEGGLADIKDQLNQGGVNRVLSYIPDSGYNDPMPTEEQTLITASINGDLKSFETLILPFEKRVFNFLFKMCQNKEAAEDMLQDTFLTVFHKLKEFRAEAKLSTWIFQIAANNCLMLKRKSGREMTGLLAQPEHENEKKITLDLPDWSKNPADMYETQELKELLDKSLAQLPEIYRAMFILKDIEGFSAQEIIQMTGLSLANVKARTLRARVMLQSILKKEEQHHER